jgi:4a-hydroxytetrahydrobiopterin dehydratase
MSELTQKECIPCSIGTPPLKEKQITIFLTELGSQWNVVEGHHLEREFSFEDFVQALAFTNKLGALAETEGHHPDIYLAWGKVKVTIWTHKIDGLSESDFVLAAKINAL